MKKCKMGLFSLYLQIAFSVCASAGELGVDDLITPAINPERGCITEGMTNPSGTNYRYLYSRDCGVVYVLPPSVVKQDIKARGINLNACQGYSSVNRSLGFQQKKLEGLEAEIFKLEGEREAASTETQYKKLEKKIEALNQKIALYRAEVDQALKKRDEYYGETPGAIFSILLNSEIAQAELNTIRGHNHSNLNRKVSVKETTVNPDGTTTERNYDQIIQSSLRPAPIGFSIYSFDLKVPGNALKNGGIISTSLPNLEYLEQAGTKTGTVHVKAGDVVSGDITMSLLSVCDNLTPNFEGKYEMQSSANPIFSINRTFEIQKTFNKGYVAHLKVDKVVEQIIKQTTTHTNNGFKKSVTFEPHLNSNISEILDFTWNEEFKEKDSASTMEVLEIKKTVAGKLIDDYFDKLVEAGLLHVAKPEELDAATGGIVEETQVANRCWSEKRGGLGGLVGRRRTVCADYTYKVSVWKDGESVEDLKTKLNIQTDIVDAVSINSTHPFYFTTAFEQPALFKEIQ